MKTITLQIPDEINIESNELLMILATKLYESGKLSLGKAANLVGLSKPTFAESLGQYGVSIFNFPVDDLSKDVKNA